MRATVAWLAVTAVSVMMGVVLYSTSLGGSTMDYREAVVSPRPVPTIVKTRTKTKIIRKPAKTKIVYVPQAVPAPVSQPAAAPESTAAEEVVALIRRQGRRRLRSGSGAT